MSDLLHLAVAMQALGNAASTGDDEREVQRAFSSAMYLGCEDGDLCKRSANVFQLLRFRRPERQP